MLKVDDEVIRAAFESGMDLNDYSAQVEAQLKAARNLTVQDCIEQADKLADLHNGISACDEAFAVSSLFGLLCLGNAFLVCISYAFDRKSLEENLRKIDGLVENSTKQ